MRLVVSGLGEETGGGLYASDGISLEEIDRLSSSGLTLAGDTLARALVSSDETFGGELLLYDGAGVRQYLRIDEAADTHDVAWDGERFVVVSALANRVLWVLPSGEVSSVWQAPGEGDAWHLNGALLHDGRLFLCAFGRFAHHREWGEPGNDSRGVVFDASTGEDVIRGLSSPHHPRFFDGHWAVCNSKAREVLQLDRTGQVTRRVALDGWTRGFAIADDVFFVGESAHRHDPEASASASIAVLDRDTWTVRDRIELPCREVYDLLLVPAPIVAGLRRGFRTNPQRTVEQSQLSLFWEAGVRPARLWATGDPLPPEGCRVAVTAAVPPSLEAGSLVDLECRVENVGGAILVSAPPHPVLLSYRWLDALGVPLSDDSLRAKLPRSLPPGESSPCRLWLRAPSAPGRFTLRITLVQEAVAWFDDLDERNACTAAVDVRGS